MQRGKNWVDPRQTLFTGNFVCSVINCYMLAQAQQYYYYYYYYMIYIAPISRIESEAQATLKGEHD